MLPNSLELELRVQKAPSNAHAVTNRVFVSEADYLQLKRRRAEASARSFVQFAAAARKIVCNAARHAERRGHWTAHERHE